MRKLWLRHAPASGEALTARSELLRGLGSQAGTVTDAGPGSPFPPDSHCEGCVTEHSGGGESEPWQAARPAPPRLPSVPFLSVLGPWWCLDYRAAPRAGRPEVKCPQPSCPAHPVRFGKGVAQIARPPAGATARLALQSPCPWELSATRDLPSLFPVILPRLGLSAPWPCWTPAAWCPLFMASCGTLPPVPRQSASPICSVSGWHTDSPPPHWLPAPSLPLPCPLLGQPLPSQSCCPCPLC